MSPAGATACNQGKSTDLACFRGFRRPCGFLETPESVGADDLLDQGEQHPLFEADVLLERAGESPHVRRVRVAGG